MPRIGLVLGAGGVVGHAFHAGVLAAVAETTGWDAVDAEVVVGTSAGALVGALIRAGFSAPDLAAKSLESTVSPAGQELLDRAEAARSDVGPIPSREEYRRGFATSAAPGALARAALRPWRARPGPLTAALLPEGTVPTDVVVAGLRPLFDAWPDAPLWVNAVALDLGTRVTFGRDPLPPVSVADAVAASCAIPSFFTPKMIDGVRYVDGGVHSPTNADLLAGLELDLVVVSSPMSIAASGPRLTVDQPARRLARWALGREVERIRALGTPVLTFQPTPADLTIMNGNAMDEARRDPVTRSAFDSATERLVSPRTADRTAILRNSRHL